MNIKKILSRKSEIRPGKDFDKKFWNKFDGEFDKENRKLRSWGWGTAFAAAAVFAIIMVSVPQFSDNFNSKLSSSEVDAIVDEMLQLNSYLNDDLEVDIAFDYEGYSEL
ncbi:MAG: hypothetical protein KAG61_06440 [Bacteriovoracaceae bacterium]|nr:hypothetical protein [Bacteriovoracaceae bacterium]